MGTQIDRNKLTTIKACLRQLTDSSCDADSYQNPSYVVSRARDVIKRKSKEKSKLNQRQLNALERLKHNIPKKK